MDPITLATIALTLIATKATEKVGEKLGEKLGKEVMSSGKKALAVLGRKAPDTVKRLEAANPDVIEAEIIEEVKRVAGADPEIRAAMDATATAAQSDAIALQNLTQLAEKIGVVNLGKVEHQTNNISI